MKRLKIRCAIRSDAGRVCTYFFLSFADEGVWFGLVERVSVHVEVGTLKEYGGRYIDIYIYLQLKQLSHICDKH